MRVLKIPNLHSVMRRKRLRVHPLGGGGSKKCQVCTVIVIYETACFTFSNFRSLTMMDSRQTELPIRFSHRLVWAFLLDRKMSLWDITRSHFVLQTPDRYTSGVLCFQSFSFVSSFLCPLDYHCKSENLCLSFGFEIG